MMLNKLGVPFHKLNLEEKQDIVYREEDASISAPTQATTCIEIAPVWSVRSLVITEIDGALVSFDGHIADSRRCRFLSDP